MNKSQDEIDRSEFEKWYQHRAILRSVIKTEEPWFAALTYERNRKSEEVAKSFEDYMDEHWIVDNLFAFKRTTGNRPNKYDVKDIFDYAYAAGVQAEKERVR